MARIEPVELDDAPARTRELLDEYALRAGEPGPMVRTMANAPALLRGYLDLSRAMKRSHLDRRVTGAHRARRAGVDRLRVLPPPRRPRTRPAGTRSR
jgi:hypothetical protein